MEQEIFCGLDAFLVDPAEDEGKVAMTEAAMADLRERFIELTKALAAYGPSREMALARTNLEQAALWAGVHLAKHGPVPVTRRGRERA